MSKKPGSGGIMLAFIAVLVGLFGAYIVRGVLQRPSVKVAKGPQLITIPMASMELQAGRTVSLGDVALARMTRSEMEERGISRAFMTDTKQIIGRVLRTSMKRGERFDTTLFYPDGMGPGLENRLKPGMRAVTIPVRSENALLGFAGPGNWVDVIFRSGSSHSGGDSNEGRYAGDDYNNARYDHNPAWQDYSRYYDAWNGGPRRISGAGNHADQYSMEQTVTLLENVQVLAIDRETFEGISVDKLQAHLSVTLAVTPEQAASLRVVDGRGELSLTLRNPNDTNTVLDTAPRTLRDIIDIPEVATPEPPQVNGMEVYRGFRVDHINFIGTGINSRRAGGNSSQDYGGRFSTGTDPGSRPDPPSQTLQDDLASRRSGRSESSANDNTARRAGPEFPEPPPVSR